MSTSDNEASIIQERAAASTSAEGGKKIMVRTSDGVEFALDKDVGMEMVSINNFYGDDIDGASTETVMPLPNVESWEMEKVIEYVQKHLKLQFKEDRDKEMKAFQAEFIKEMSTRKMLELATTVNYLDIKYLLDFLSLSVANRLKNKSVEYVRKLFGLENDFTPEEYAEVLAEIPPEFFEGCDDED